MIASSCVYRSALKLIGWALLLVAPQAHAQEPACKSPNYQWEMNTCARTRFEHAEAELGKMYESVAARMKETDSKLANIDPKLVGVEAALGRTQRAWIEYRDGHCESIGSRSAPGSMQPMMVWDCKKELTERRMKELADLVYEQN